jgi:hypothetical protein
MTIYYGLAVSASMFEFGTTNVHVEHFPLSRVQAGADSQLDFVNSLVSNAINCMNHSHAATIDALQHMGFLIGSPEKEPPIVNLKVGDKLVVFQISGLPRLTDRHQYTRDEIASADISIILFCIH